MMMTFFSQSSRHFIHVCTIVDQDVTLNPRAASVFGSSFSQSWEMLALTHSILVPRYLELESTGNACYTKIKQVNYLAFTSSPSVMLSCSVTFTLSHTAENSVATHLLKSQMCLIDAQLVFCDRKHQYQ